MSIRKRVGRAVLACGVAITVVVGVGTSASATTNQPSIFSGNNSDPWIYPCFYGNFSGWCAYTSHDMNMGGQNSYPMDNTYVHTWSPSSNSNPADPAAWSDPNNGGTALKEADYSAWVTGGTNHMWAPNAAYGPNFDMYLYVPSTPTASNIYSHIGVSTSAAPWGPFTYQRQVTFKGADVGNTYMSDPFVFQSMGGYPSWGPAAATRLNGSARWLYWANGNFDTSGIACGGISGALLDDATMSEIYTESGSVSASGSEISITGMSGMANCGNKGRPYLEGPDVYFTNLWGFAFGANGERPYMMVMSAKPSNSNQVIAYASASNPLGPYQYEGNLLGASGSSWTQQASIAADSSSGSLKLFLIFHDDSGGTNHNRKTYMTCLTFDLSDKKFVEATRPTSSNIGSCPATRA